VNAIRFDANMRRPRDYMGIGDDVAISRNNNSGSRASLFRQDIHIRMFIVVFDSKAGPNNLNHRG
jgi:hypothetical protein